jgi:hypothetical protein
MFVFVIDVIRRSPRDQTPVRRHAVRVSFFVGAPWYKIARRFDRTTVRPSSRCSTSIRRQSMSVVTHKSVVRHRSEVETPVEEPRTARLVRRGVPGRPPTRRRVAGAPRVLARRPCDVPEPRLSPVWVLAVASVAFAAVVGLGMLASSVAPSVPSTTKVVRVLPGESLWELAGRVAPDSDPSAVVDRIRELNGVEGSVFPGQPLTVPYSK